LPSNAGGDMLYWKPEQQISSFVPKNKAQQLQFDLRTATDNMRPKGAANPATTTHSSCSKLHDARISSF
jgi:hypothetical protein